MSYDFKVLSAKAKEAAAPLEAQTGEVDYGNAFGVGVMSASGQTRYSALVKFWKAVPNPKRRWWTFWRPRKISVRLTQSEAEAAVIDATRTCVAKAAP